MADWREDYQARRILGVRALRAFPRSAGLITTAVYAVVTLDPIFALGPGFSVWLVLRIINWVIAVVMPDIVDRNLWSCCLYLVVPIGGWVLRWPITVVAAVLAILLGADAGDTALVMGGILGLDIVLTLVLGW